MAKMGSWLADQFQLDTAQHKINIKIKTHREKYLRGKKRPRKVAKMKRSKTAQHSRGRMRVMKRQIVFFSPSGRDHEGIIYTRKEEMRQGKGVGQWGVDLSMIIWSNPHTQASSDRINLCILHLPKYEKPFPSSIYSMLHHFWKWSIFILKKLPT